MEDNSKKHSGAKSSTMETKMKLKVKLTNRAILRSGLDLEGNSWEMDFQVSDMPTDARTLLADRLLDDTFVCVGCVNEDGEVEPGLTGDGLPDLLRLDGTEIRHLVAALRLDDEEVKACFANMAMAAAPAE